MTGRLALYVIPGTGLGMRLAVVADSHLARPAGAVYANVLAVQAWVGATRPDATLHLGDVTADAAQHPEQLDAVQGLLAAWPGPLHLLAGNHDVGDNDDPARSASEPAIDAARVTRFRRALGADRFHLTWRRWTLIGLNAQLLGSGGDEAEQDAWLDTVLAQAMGPVGLFLHKPLFLDAASERVRHPRYVPPEPRARLLARLHAHDVRFVACGHAHQLRRRVVEDVEHAWVPSCAFIIPDTMQERLGEKVVGTMTLTLTEKRHAFDVVVPPGVECHDLLDEVDLYPHLSQRRAD